MRSDEITAERALAPDEGHIAKRSDGFNGLTRRQRHFILEKLVGLSDKDAALAAGYSLSVAESTKRRIWTPLVRTEFERLRARFPKTC